MAKTDDNFERMRIQLTINLKLLSIDDFIRRSKENIPINPQTFRPLTPKAFQLITYFLFKKLSPEECGKRFNGCYPVLDRKQEGEFRQTTNRWFQEIVVKESGCHNFPRVVPIYFQHFSPEPIVCQLYLEFTNYLMEKEIRKLSSGGQHLRHINDINDVFIGKTLEEYQIIKNQIKKQSEEWTQKMGYFVETFCKLRDKLKVLSEEKDVFLGEIRQNYGLTDESDVNCFLENHIKQFSSSVANLKIKLKQMNELVAKNSINYSMAFISQNDTSIEMSIDFNQWFSQTNSFASVAQKFVLLVDKYDSRLKNVSDNSLEKFSNISIEFSTEILNFKNHLIEFVPLLRSMLEQLKSLCQKRKLELLNNPVIKERRKAIGESVPDISKLKFRFQLKPRVKKTEQLSKPVIENNGLICMNESISQEYMSRPSISDYSFQLMEMSSCQYIPPNSYPLAMNDSQLFSPIETEDQNAFHSKSENF